MLLKAEKLEMGYGIQTLFSIDRLVLEDGARVGLVGRNGAGKTTLLRILSGELQPDRGVVKRYGEIALIRQNPGTGAAVAGRMDAAGNGDAVVSRDNETGYQLDRQQISRLGLRESAVKSGGERMRFAIAEAFSRHAPLLFADEPTTNLDVEGIRLLEHMLRGYRGGLLLVSHDRKLLDDVCTEIWELEDGGLRVFPGNYSDWAAQKAREREHERFEFDQYRREKRRLEQAVTQVEAAAGSMKKPPRKMGNSEWMLYKGIASDQQRHVSDRGSAMKSRLSHLEVKERPAELPQVSMTGMHLTKIKAKYAAKISGLTVTYGTQVVLDQVELKVESGKRTFLVGKNGAGKSTLLSALAEGAPGTFFTEDARVGYFSQNLLELKEDRTLLENVLYEAAEPEHICRAVLANLYVSREDLGKKVSVLSGGERVKTALAKLLVSGCNFYLLDEPTNHMDIYTMEGLEELLMSYPGTLLVVSHDRRLVEKLADVVYLVEGGSVALEPDAAK